MIRSVVRALTLGVSAAASLLAAHGASATVFYMTTANSGPVASPSGIVMPKSDTSSLTLTAYGAHLGAANAKGIATSYGATAETYQNAGLGVLFGKDTESDGSHQIDNHSGFTSTGAVDNGVDYAVLVFNAPVTLTQVGVANYGGSNVGTGLHAQFAAYSGTLSSLIGGSGTLDESIFKDPTSDYTYSGSDVKVTGATNTSSIWLVAAYVKGTGDAFKITGLEAMPGSVPEPASWAMMIVGFGAVGGAMRRRGTAALAA